MAQLQWLVTLQRGPPYHSSWNTVAGIAYAHQSALPGGNSPVKRMSLEVLLKSVREGLANGV